jgi:hypothetical protein
MLRRRIAVAVTCAALAVPVVAAAARADDAVPSPAPSASATAEPTPTPEPSATPQPTPASAKPATQSSTLRVGSTGARVTKLQQKLEWLGYPIDARNWASERFGQSTATAVKKFQIKWGLRPTGVVGPVTSATLSKAAGTVGKLPAACTTAGVAICVDKTQRLVRFVDNDTVIKTLDARFGFWGAETDEGVFHVNSKSRDHTSSLYRTWMPFALFFSGGQAVHYSPYFARDGYNGGSHGCVNLRDYEGAKWIFDHTPIGSRVVVYRS